MKMSLGKKLLCWLLCATMLLSLTAPALAEDTTLRMEFRGLLATTEGWVSVPLSGTFTVMQDDQAVGTLEAVDAISNTIALTGDGAVRLVPDMDTMPEDYECAEGGYSVSVTAGVPNVAPVMVYALAGLFEVQAEGAAEFELLNAEDEVALTFTTDENGFYALPEAMAAGVYTLRQTDGASPMEDKVFELPMYRGIPDQIVRIDSAFVSQPELHPDWVPTEAPTEVPTDTPEPTAEPTAEPTEEPTAEPTEEPTEEPTAEPTAEPTEEPTAEPTEEPTPEPTAEPTEEPTEEPTPEPTPAEGILRLDVQGDAHGSYTLEKDGELVAYGDLTPGETAVTEPLPEGTYIMTLLMGNGVMLASLNGQTTDQYDQAQWQVVIQAGEDSLYQCELIRTAGITGLVSGVEAAEITAMGSRGTYTTSLIDGAFAFESLYPDTYQIIAHLPAGDYVSDGWTIVPTEGGVNATVTMTLESGSLMGLPALEYIFYGSLSGWVISSDGNPISGAAVTLLGSNGAELVQTVTDKSGAWRFEHVAQGAYVLRASQLGGLSAADRNVTMGSADVADVQITAARTGTLGVSAFVDANDNGGRGRYEPFLDGVEVSLYTAGDEPTLVATGVTEKNSNEYWAVFFENVPAGDYFVRTTVPEGYGYGTHVEGYRTMDNLMYPSDQRVQDSPVFPVEAGKKLYIGVGALPLSSLTGSAWVDLNGDGVYQPDEPGQAGVKITLTRKTGETYSLTTDGSDTYAFEGILPGKYELTFSLPDGMMFTRKADGRNVLRSLVTTEGQSSGSVTVTVEPGKTLDNQNVGLLEGSGIAGVCFQDANYNGLYDAGELPMAGVQLALMQQGKSKAVAETVSAEDGTFSFPGLRGGGYDITATLPDDGSVFTLVTGDGNQFAARSGRRDQTVSGLTVADSHKLHLVIGAVYPSSVSGTAYLDDNFSGARESGEEAVRGLTVFLLDASGEQVAETRTGNDGGYSFEGLMPGSYRLSLSAQAGYAFTKLGEGNVIVNTGNGTGSSELFEAPIGSQQTGFDMGMILPGVVEGVVFADLNDNGVQDEGEAGLPGTVVRLIEAREGEAFSATIGTDGAYRFDAVMPGNYYLRFELPEGGVFSEGSDIEFIGNEGESRPFAFKTGLLSP